MPIRRLLIPDGEAAHLVSVEDPPELAIDAEVHVGIAVATDGAALEDAFTLSRRHVPDERPPEAVGRDVSSARPQDRHAQQIVVVVFVV